jgi:hypothetical protein
MEGGGEGNLRGSGTIGGESGNRCLLGDNHHTAIVTNRYSRAASPATPAMLADMGLCGALAYKKHGRTRRTRTTMKNKKIEWRPTSYMFQPRIASYI